jgi:hypothetical protein
MGTPLRLVPRSPRRESVIVDMTYGHEPRFTPPWTAEEAHRLLDAPIPLSVMSAMYVASWARAEHCPLNIFEGRLEPHCRYTPTDALYCAVAQTMGGMVGSLFFAIPVLLDDHKRAWAASWRMFWERN